MDTVLITGGTGFTGKILTQLLLGKGYRVIVLSRSDKSPADNSRLIFSKWDPASQVIDLSLLAEARHIIHLAGAGVMEKRWTGSYKKKIIESRVNSARFIIHSLKLQKHLPETFISASAIGWYGADKRGAAFSEEAAPDRGFLGETCRLWEEAAEEAAGLGIRVCCLRTGIVLGNGEGAFTRFSKPVRYGIAPVMGNGKQVMSWIHATDLCRMYLYALESNFIKGSYNATAPNPVSNKTFMLQLARSMRGTKFIPVHIPAFALKLALGEASEEVLKSCTVSSKKISSSGFTFLYPSVEAAFTNLCKPL